MNQRRGFLHHWLFPENFTERDPWHTTFNNTETLFPAVTLRVRVSGLFLPEGNVPSRLYCF